jgi:hypothetical protein
MKPKETKFPATGFTQISRTRQPKRNWLSKIEPLHIRIVFAVAAPYLQGCDGDWPGAGETGGVLRAHSACKYNLGVWGFQLVGFPTTPHKI